MAKMEPTKEGNDAAIAELKRETRGQVSFKYHDAVSGQHAGSVEAYKVVASLERGGRVTVALFPYFQFDGSRDAARIMAEELAERINAQ